MWLIVTAGLNSMHRLNCDSLVSYDYSVDCDGMVNHVCLVNAVGLISFDGLVESWWIDLIVVGLPSCD